MEPLDRGAAAERGTFVLEVDVPDPERTDIVRRVHPVASLFDEILGSLGGEFVTLRTTQSLWRATARAR